MSIPIQTTLHDFGISADLADSVLEALTSTSGHDHEDVSLTIESLLSIEVPEARARLIATEIISLLEKKSQHVANNSDSSVMVSEVESADEPVTCSVSSTSNPSLVDFMSETHNDDPKKRREALRKLCPCRVKAKVDPFWTRIIEMTSDPDANVRYQVLHNLCDGSPNDMEEIIVEAIERFRFDTDKKIRNRVNRVLTSYRRTGKWNIL